MAAVQSVIQKAFQTAMHDFKMNLNNDEIHAQILLVTSIEGVYDLTDKLQAEQGRKGHLRHLAKIEPYLNRLREYTAAIELFVQIEPEIMALIWGPIKLLLQWTSVPTQSFDAILNTTADIGLLLPEFQEVAVLFSRNDKIYDVLVLFFRDILDFYQICLQFFIMPRWKYFFESLWPRKRDHIDMVKAHIQRHTSLMRNEVRLEHIREEHDARLRALEHYKKSERADRLQKYQALKTEINPRTYDDKLNWYHGRVCKGTGGWLRQDDTFKRWLDTGNRTSRVLWLQGIPGAGKTFLAGTVVDIARTASHTAFAFLSHTFRSNTSALSVLHSLIFQLASQHDDLQDVLCHSAHEHIKSNVTVAVALLKEVLGCAGTAFLVIDGVDEIDEIERGVLLKQLLLLSQECQETRILISSRQEVDITAILQPTSEVIRVDDRNEESIQIYVNHQLEQLFESRSFPPSMQDKISDSLTLLASKAKGMFLYATVVLSSIELVDDATEICEELSTLPEDLDDAYSRVLLRINKLRPSVRDKARRILAWVGCSPTPLTLPELEQALTIQPCSLELLERDYVSPNLNKLCGPIIEVVDGYIQFVHFKVKEYFFSPSVDGHIDLVNGTLDLAVCCTTYLCQRQYDVDVRSNGITSVLLNGSYRLHYLAVNCWFDLIRDYLKLSRDEVLPTQLAECLRSLMTKRSNVEFAADRDTFTTPGYLQSIKKEYPDIYDFLSDVAQFRQRCLETGYRISDGKLWINLDPLSIFHQMNRILCNYSRHKRQCDCHLIERDFGKRPFRCGFLNCSFQQYGFESRAERDRHESKHTLPWKCSVSGCEYETTGDQHMKKAHRDKMPEWLITKDIVEWRELRSLLHDLIKQNELGMVELLLPGLHDSDSYFLADVVGRYGSIQMAQVVFERAKRYEVMSRAITAQNIELVKWLIDSGNTPEYDHGFYIATFVKTDSEEMYRLCERYTAAALVGYKALNATNKILSREKFLTSLWNFMGLGRELKPTRLTLALSSIARSSCSICLAAGLIQHGADVKGSKSPSAISPLHYAARKSSAENAEFMKFPLFAGADPDRVSRKRKPSDDIDAQGISRWLGISWGELVAQTRNHRRGLIV
ncbi:NACHT domain protein [Aspergillus sclerotioniger CBS 115572]|uniref:NACHT domain protein n=1 Tax=Aspergillus sclerotioniger CBS 115572 TaxID=1450535 RepID=A0A317XDN8_9EURO|nr:NACHT domain protein [Aspergillus sclerotioniger CBS 115572]PWY96736.1 NACHT domain protein [Aspergillus sclerotioniger CBS 115572]